MESTLGDIRILLSGQIKSIQSCISHAFGVKRLRWVASDTSLRDWTRDLMKRINDMQNKKDDVSVKIQDIESLLIELDRCRFTSHDILMIFGKLQRIIDSIKACDGLDAYVDSIEKRAYSSLKSLLLKAIRDWLDKLVGSADDDDDLYVCELVLIDQTLQLSPSLSSCRQHWIHSLSCLFSVACSVPKLTSTQYHIFSDSREKSTYDHWTVDVMDALSNAMTTINDAVNLVHAYVNKWLVYQSLWDLDYAVVDESIGNDLSKWYQLLTEMRSGRAMIDSSVGEMRFGLISVGYRNTKDKIGLRYDIWQKETQQRLSVLLGTAIHVCWSDLSLSKEKLEGSSLEGSIEDVVSGVYLIQNCKTRFDRAVDDVKMMSLSESLLIKSRFKLHDGWMSVARVDGIINDLGQLLQRRIKSMESKMSSLQSRLLEEERRLVKRMDDVEGKWRKDKPIDGSIVPSDALAIISSFSSLSSRLRDELERLGSAKSALGVESISHDSLKYVDMEISDFRDVWSTMLPVWTELDLIKDCSWKTYVPLTFKKSVDDLSERCRSMSLNVKTYEVYSCFTSKLSILSSVLSLLRDLRSESMKDRHWKLVLKKLSISKLFDELILADLIHGDLVGHKKWIEDVLSTAQGEAALEEFLRQTREYWSLCEFSLVLKDGFHLISSWSLLLNKLDESLNLLASIKHSPYYRSVQEFQNETVSWEETLTNLRTLLQLWVEVQKHVTYLRGIFDGGDIRLQLAAQYMKYKAVEGEYSSFMKRIHSRPRVIDVVSMSGLLRLLEKLDNAMNQLRRDLSDYLENQRMAFPRFYFVCNDDLVEIVGNSSQPLKIMPHLIKMFAGLCSIDIEMRGGFAVAVACVSREGEKIRLTKGTRISDKDQQSREWLSAIDNCLKDSVRKDAVDALRSISADSCLGTGQDLSQWVYNHSVQAAILSLQIYWTRLIEQAINTSSIGSVCDWICPFLTKLSSSCVHGNVSPLFRKKIEHLVTEVIYQRDVTQQLRTEHVSTKSYAWLRHLRFCINDKDEVNSQMANSSFPYGFEYLGVGERLVQTPLTDRCYLTLMQAMHFRLGGSPFGPAGTGKTESVKMLGAQLGRLVLVFNCDETFDYASMGRLFSGLCQVGAWGCFDEFNRLEERILSSVSQQILTIQRGLIEKSDAISLLGSQVNLNPNVGIFITMNPGYAGRRNLPENLKGLFRAVAMAAPDKLIIAQVMLFSQGLLHANTLASKIVLLFSLFQEQLSHQPHYDFGLRALKSVLISAGELKRKYIRELSNQLENKHDDDDAEIIEYSVLIRSVCDTVLPKLVADDVPLYESLLYCVFPNSSTKFVRDSKMVAALTSWCKSNEHICGDLWLDKVLQLRQVVEVRHGVMLVGPTGCGKTSVWKALVSSLDSIDNCVSDVYVIEPKAVTKEELFGSLDANTLDWKDGLFTSKLRKIIEHDEEDRLNGLAAKRHWIVFDGDVDPEWVENLNSVLDDNKILTLPTGDRLRIPESSRIIMEVDSLKSTTMATISRCGMIWFSDDVVTIDMMCQQLLSSLSSSERDVKSASTSKSDFIEAISGYFSSSFVRDALSTAMKEKCVINVPKSCYILSLKSFLESGIRSIIDYEFSFGKGLMSSDVIIFAKRWFFFSVFWAFTSACDCKSRLKFSTYLMNQVIEDFPTGMSLYDIFPSLSLGCWCTWRSKVETIAIDPSKISSTDIVVPTTDFVRHAEIIRHWLGGKTPFVLCGPPGCGKTMTLMNLLQSMTDQFIPVFVSFSSGSKSDAIFSTLRQYCEVSETPYGLVMRPNKGFSSNHWISLFCDEINLPENDKYGTQKINMLIRQLIEQGGFWSHDHSFRWVTLERILFVGACNPAADVGRIPLSDRLMRHVPVLFVDFPGEESLNQIYNSLNTSLLRLHPAVRHLNSSLTLAMIDVYLKNQEHFTSQTRAHYVYSPRELSRWVRGMHEAIGGVDNVSEADLIRLWAHEGERLFSDRLVSQEESKWCESTIREVARLRFHVTDAACLQGPILYTHWLSRVYQSVDLVTLKDFVKARLKQFADEVLDLPLVLFDDVLKHVLRINHVLRNPLGHLLLVGDSGVGKTVLTKFVAWMNNLQVFQIKANRRYSIDQFDDDLKSLLRRAGVNNEAICFIFDESNAVTSSFVERMNSLLALGEIPGLFSGEDLRSLLVGVRESIISERNNLARNIKIKVSIASVDTDSDDSVYRYFVSRVQRNLHVVFTMNPASTDFNNRCCTSPALFNRCVIDWFGRWSDVAMIQVASEFTRYIDTSFTHLSQSSFINNESVAGLVIDMSKTAGKHGMSVDHCLVAALVDIHKHSLAVTERLRCDKGTNQLSHYLSPRDFLDFIQRFCATEQMKRNKLEDEQLHIRRGLDRLNETQDQVSGMKSELSVKEDRLQEKSVMANEKLNLMIERQSMAEKRRAEAVKLANELERQNSEIAFRLSSVERDLSEAEPALSSARQSVQAIRRIHLDEVRTLSRPPNPVKITLEAVSVMLGEKTTEWTELRKFLRRDDFISTIVNFDPASLTQKQIKSITDDYLSNGEFDIDSVSHASKACGPLCQWVTSQINYSNILKNVEPLRNEVVRLQGIETELRSRKLLLDGEIGELERSIGKYKSEYAVMILDIENIKTEMNQVLKKIKRAESLLESLGSEKIRWNESSASFDHNRSNLIGDCLIMSAYMCYAGAFDSLMRKSLKVDWMDIIQSLNLSVDNNLDLAGFMSSPAQQLRWKSEGLSDDSLCIENAILLDHQQRFCLLVDPSGLSTQFLLSRFANKNVQQTSFLDDQFVKLLTSCIRFGTPLVINDAEHADPIINSVLNREVTRSGGRLVIRIGREDVDYSPKFTVLLISRNAQAKLLPDLCSRVGIINFSVTESSFQSNCLGAILKFERPDVEKRRTDLARVRSEQAVKMRELEESLLQAISSAEGNILNDDSVSQMMETVKRESFQLNLDIESNSRLLVDLKSATTTYESLSLALTKCFFVVQRLSGIASFYQFTLPWFMSIVSSVLSVCQQQQMDQRIIFDRFIDELSRKSMRGLLSDDRRVLSFRLAQIACEFRRDMSSSRASLWTDDECTLLLKGRLLSALSEDKINKTRSTLLPLGVEFEAKVVEFINLSLLPRFRDTIDLVLRNADAWRLFFSSTTPEDLVPLAVSGLGERESSMTSFFHVLVLRLFRPDRVFVACDRFVTSVFGRNIAVPEYESLSQVCASDVTCQTPLMLCCDVGLDPGSIVDEYVRSTGHSIYSIAIGSAESLTLAEKAIHDNCTSGGWVLVKNVHLCSDWLSTLEKKFNQWSKKDSFRLFMTSEVSSSLPSSWIKSCVLLIYESSSGIRSSMERIMMSVPPARMERLPVERSKLYLLLSWFHAQCQERVVYAPIGWSKRYEFEMLMPFVHWM